MSFLKKLFGTKSKPNNTSSHQEKPLGSNLSVQSEESIQSVSKHAIEILNELFVSKKIKHPNNQDNHPLNIDIALKYKDDVLAAFTARGFDVNMLIVSLAYSYSDYLVKNHNFKLYIDKETKDTNSSLVLLHNRAKELAIYPTDQIISALKGKLLLFDFLNDLIKKLPTENTPEVKKENTEITYEEIPGMTDMRLKTVSICIDAGYKPSRSLPTSWDRQLRPALDIAGRLHAIKALVIWLMVPPENVSSDMILNFVDQNNLRDFMTEDELVILTSSRDDQELRNAIGWKFENAWPLAWYFGYETPEITGSMMSGEQMQDILVNYTCSLDGHIVEWCTTQNIVSEETLIEKEDLFYCLHNAVRSAQLGRDTVPQGFDPIGNGGVIHERRHSLTWMLSKDIKWEETDLST